MNTPAATPAPTISSFVIRFVTEPESQTYRGEIRHIQTGQELAFTQWEDAESFLRAFVPSLVVSDKGQVTRDKG